MCHTMDITSKFCFPLCFPQLPEEEHKAPVRDDRLNRLPAFSPWDNDNINGSKISSLLDIALLCLEIKI